MQSVKKTLQADNNENEKQTVGDQDFQKALKNFSKKAQETKRAQKRHNYYLSPRDKNMEKRASAAKKKKIRR